MRKDKKISLVIYITIWLQIFIAESFVRLSMENRQVY